MSTPDAAQIRNIVNRAREEVEEGLLPSCQIALAFESELICNEVFGEANLQTKYCLYSATKPLVAATLAMLIGEGLINLADPVSDYLPRFGENEKRFITVEQVMLHQSGIPNATLAPSVGNSRDERLRCMASWTLEWTPGQHYEYHPTSAHWIQAALIDELTGSDFRDVIQQRLTARIGLPRILGIPANEQASCAHAFLVGESANPEQMKSVYGVEKLPARDHLPELVLSMNEPKNRELGVPGAGGFARAADIALFYQELLHNNHHVWSPEISADITSNVRSMLVERNSGLTAFRTVAMVTAGNDGWSHRRGFGSTVSPLAFGHDGAGGQLGWADPTSGISMCYTTNGFDRNEIRQPNRDASIASLAGSVIQ